MAQRRIKLAVGAACAGVAAYVVLPAVVEHRVRARLVDGGFPDARVEVASVGLGHLALRNVHLADGIDLGSLDLDRGLSLLWSPPNEVAIRNANVSTAAVARVAPSLKRSQHKGSPPFQRARVDDSIVDVDGKRTRVDGTATAATTDAFDITVSVRDPSPKGWALKGRGRVVLGKQAKLENGHVDVTLPRATLTPEVLGDVVVSADVSGDRRNLKVSARASVLGGDLVLEPFETSAKSFDLVVHARGLQLAKLLQPTHHITGSGVVDGTVALRVDKRGWTLQHGELHARQPGTLQLTNPEWRQRAAQAASPLALHTKLTGALSDFQFDALKAELAPPGSGGSELKVSARGRGRRNHQELDVAIGIRGARDVAARLPGASK